MTPVTLATQGQLVLCLSPSLSEESSLTRPGIWLHPSGPVTQAHQDLERSVLGPPVVQPFLTSLKFGLQMEL